MSGLSVNCFVDLSAVVAKHLLCCICFSIYNKPVNTNCGHTFCLDCIRTSIQSNGKVCPECRHTLITKKRKGSNSSYNVLVIENDVILEKNLIINNMINDLPIKCNFDYKGCEEVIEFCSLDSHLKTCPFRLCSDCNIDENVVKEHNCVEVLKKSNHELKKKIEKQTKDLNKMSKELKIKDKTICDLKKQLNDISVNNQMNENIGKELKKFQIIFVPNCVHFGTHRINDKFFKVLINNQGLRISGVFSNMIYVFIPFLEIREIKICLVFPFIFVKPDITSCKKIQEFFHLNPDQSNDFIILSSYDVTSNEMDKQFVKIKVNRGVREQLKELMKTMGEYNTNCVFESIDVFRANQLMGAKH